MSLINVKLVETEAERLGHYAVRRAIFVEEQQLFYQSEVDEYDEESDTIHIVAVSAETGAVVGAVRCYRASADEWYGGRLAVLPEYRHDPAAIGANLCRLAEVSVSQRGCRRFLAYIQVQNVRFFQRLKWAPVGEPVDYHGQPHQLMAASLTLTQFEPVNVNGETAAHA
jgi:putative N-acetyltransferase (TIGR04045 family)